MTSLSATFTGPQFYNDCIGPVSFGPFADDLVRRFPPDPPGDVLEIACGTGIVTERLRRRLDPSLRLVATDLSPVMLGYARERLAGQDIDWRVADALQLPLADSAFGAVVCGFGLMFVPDRQAALREARRVLKPGGLLLFNVWDRIEENSFALANAGVLEALFPDDPEMKFRVPYDMHDPALLRALLAGADFRETAIEVKRLEVAGADPRAIATGQIRGTPRSALIEKRGVALDLVIDKVVEALSRTGGNPYHGHAQAVIVQAEAV